MQDFGIDTESSVQRKKIPNEKYKSSSGPKSNKFQAEMNPNKAAICRFLSIVPRVLSFGDKRAEVSMPLSFNSFKLYSLWGTCIKSSYSVIKNSTLQGEKHTVTKG